MIGFIFRAVIAAVGLWIATRWVTGIQIDTPTTLVLAGLLLGIINAIVRPIAIVLTLPITLLTLGFFLLIVNAGMLGLVAYLLPGFRIASFGAAFLAAIIITITGWIGSALFGSQGKIEVIRSSR
jgi:putative membrane protein